MIYELSLVAKSELSDEQIAALKGLVSSVLEENKGEVLVSDDWGRLTFAQPTSAGITTGRYLYFIFKVDNAANNTELIRRFRINEGVLKHMIFSLGSNEEQEELIKAYKTPYSKAYNGSLVEEEESAGKEKKKFARSKSCWFQAKQIKANWKDPKTYSWVVNEFGKISPARVTGISRKHQRFVTTAVKQARNIGLLSHVSNYVAKKQ